MAEPRKMDARARISLPSRWRKKQLHELREVTVIEKGNMLLVKPKVKPNLTRHFNSVEIDANPDDFTDYSKLKKTFLRRRSR